MTMSGVRNADPVPVTERFRFASGWISPAQPPRASAAPSRSKNGRYVRRPCIVLSPPLSLAGTGSIRPRPDGCPEGCPGGDLAVPTERHGQGRLAGWAGPTLGRRTPAGVRKFLGIGGRNRESRGRRAPLSAQEERQEDRGAVLGGGGHARKPN